MSSSSSSSSSTSSKEEEEEEEELSASASIVRAGRCAPPWAVVVEEEDATSTTTTQKSFVFFDDAQHDDVNDVNDDDDVVLSFRLAPNGEGRATIANGAGWRHAFETTTTTTTMGGSTQKKRLLAYFLDVDAIASSTEVAVSVQNETHRATVGFVPTRREEDFVVEGNTTVPSSYPLRKVREKLDNFNAVSFADESGVGGDVAVKSVRLRAISRSGEGGGGERETNAQGGEEDEIVLLPAFEVESESTENQSTGIDNDEGDATFLFDAKDKDSERTLVIGVSVACAVVFAVFVVVCYFAKRRMKEGKQYMDGNGGDRKDRQRAWLRWLQHLDRVHDDDDEKKKKNINKPSESSRRMMAPASEKHPSTLEILVHDEAIPRMSNKPPKSNVSTSLTTTEDSPRGGMDRLQLLRRSTKDTTPAHSRQNSLLNSNDEDEREGNDEKVPLDALAKEIENLQNTIIQSDANNRSTSSSSKLELSPDKEDEVPFEYLTEVEVEKDVRIYERLGGGAYGTVYRGKFREREVAVKTLRVNALHTSCGNEEVSEDIQMLQSEVEILRLAKHENIVSVFAACFEPIRKALLVVQLVHGGSLGEMLHRENNESVKLSGTSLRTILLDVAKAMEYLHGLTPRKILHRDLKPQNVLVEAKLVSGVLNKGRKRRGGDDGDILDDYYEDDDGDGDNAPISIEYKAYVCDFGISRLLPLMANTLKTSFDHVNAGTPNYMAPELFTGHYACSTKADVFSFGNIIYECATGRIPFDKIAPPVRIAYLVGMEDKRCEILPVDKVRNDVHDLIEKCWKTDPQKRPTFTEIVQSIARFPTRQNFDETTEEEDSTSITPINYD